MSPLSIEIQPALFRDVVAGFLVTGPELRNAPAEPLVRPLRYDGSLLRAVHWIMFRRFSIHTNIMEMHNFPAVFAFRQHISLSVLCLRHYRTIWRRERVICCGDHGNCVSMTQRADLNVICFNAVILEQNFVINRVGLLDRGFAAPVHTDDIDGLCIVAEKLNAFMSCEFHAVS